MHQLWDRLGIDMTGQGQWYNRRRRVLYGIGSLSLRVQADHKYAPIQQRIDIIIIHLMYVRNEKERKKIECMFKL